MNDAAHPAGSPAMNDADRANLIAYSFAVLRAVPHVYRGDFVNVGVVLHARTAGFLALRAVTERAQLERRLHDTDTELLARYLESCEAICRGDLDAGPVALLPTSERFHWITAPRSDVLQSSPVHAGICEDPARALDDLFAEYVDAGGNGSGSVGGTGSGSIPRGDSSRLRESGRDADS
jgi:hypothetical protein